MPTPNDVAKALHLLGVQVDEVVKGEPEDRYVLGIAHQAGPDPAIKRGADGGRDFFSERELELASRTFMRKGGMQVGLMHRDGTTEAGYADVVESYIWRGPDWTLESGEVVTKGSWMLGAVLSPEAWELVKSGQITGWSIQGTARRVANAADSTRTGSDS